MVVADYGYTTLRLFAKEITDGIGYNTMYTNTNSHYPNAPANHLFAHIGNVSNWLKKTNPTIVNIFIIEDESMDDNIYGIYIHKGSNVYITINGSLNSCWRRFAILKELCSLYTDYKDSDSKMKKYDNYMEAIENAFLQKKNLVGEGTLESEIEMDSETFSILLATELMLPYNQRKLLKDYFQEFKDKSLKMNDIAKSLRIPEFILQLYYDKNLIDCSPSFESLSPPVILN